MAVGSTDSKSKVGEAIKKFRIMKGLSIRDLSKLIQEKNKNEKTIAPSNLSAVETGERSPKMDMCLKIARALDCDPIEICGLELSEIEEQRLLMKLLNKYADEIKIGVNEDKQDVVIVNLPLEFAGFAVRYNENKEYVKLALSEISDKDPGYDVTRESAEDLFKYWLDMFPEFDGYHDAVAQNGASENVTLDMIYERDAVIESEMGTKFSKFQEEYIIPTRTQDYIRKYVIKKETTNGDIK